MRGAMAVAVLTVLAGCGPIRYARDVEEIPGNKIFVEYPTIGNADARIDKEKTKTEIRALAVQWLQRYAYQVVSSPEEADLVLKADVTQIHLGAAAARVLTGYGQSWHETTIQITAGGYSNAGYRKAEVAAGAYSNWKGDAQHWRALMDEIGKMHAWVAGKHMPR
jgi:hypothetical protein